MDAHAIVHHRLDLALRLVNSVTGKVIEERDARFLTQSPGLKAIPRGGGLYLFLNMERVDFDLEVRVYGFEPQKVKIRFSDLEKAEQVPIRDIYLLPIDHPIEDRVLTLRGNISGIEMIEAVSLSDANCCIKEFDARKKIMTVLNQRNLRFHHIHYGLVNREKTAFEHFEVEKEISTQKIKCKQMLEKPFQINQPIVRVIFGQINEHGDYVLKVANDENASYLVRYIVSGREFYQKVDFKEEGIVLVSHQEKEGEWE